MKLSVLACTIPERDFKSKDYFNDPRIEFIYLGDNCKMSIGEKRQLLLEAASGDYITFIDDDDKIDKAYIDTILEAIKSGRDVINYQVYYKGIDVQKIVLYSKDYKQDRNTKDKFLRIPNHLMVTKRSLALKAGFKDIGYGEDADYAKRLLPLIRSENNIHKILYTYQDDPKTSKSRYSNSRRS